MEHSAWKKLLDGLSHTFYLEVPVTFAALLAIYTILRKFQSKKLSYLFMAYSLACLVLFLGTNIQRFFHYLSGRSITVFIETVNTFFAISELLIFTIFFTDIIDSKPLKKLLISLACIFAIPLTLFFQKLTNSGSDRLDILKASIIINTSEFAILLIAIFLYFIQLFTKPPTLNLTQSPPFWISSGLFIYILVSLPMLLFTEHLWKRSPDLYYFLFSLHYISLTFLLLTINKAFLCRQPRTI